ncbi:MAG TPA: universal stress protein [Xanthobacteraceae bacterium]|jgi:nucleotide-binding universal stress UspA family protein|nr:universal stress protein [Xanthobacteraceae bacterium]
MIKDILVKISPAAFDHAGTYAIALAAAFEAHVSGIAFAYEPEILPDPSGQGSRRFMRIREENEEGAGAAAAQFEKQASDAGVAATARAVTTTISAGYDLFGRIARRFDLAVVGQDEPEREQSETAVAEGALFESGRPLVMVPYIHKHGLKLERVMVCWDGSRPAARAVADAMPLLARAGRVDVVIVQQAKSDEMPGADVAEHLARHDLNVTVQRIARGDVDVKDVLLNYVADSAADLVVMGGYGHSRMREFILGGVTRGMLASMTVPTLMSH